MCRDDHVRLLHTADLHYDNIMWLYKKMNMLLGVSFKKVLVTDGTDRAVQSNNRPGISGTQTSSLMFTHSCTL